MQNTTLDAALLQNNGEDISAALAEIISSTPDNTVLTLPTGRYFIGHEVKSDTARKQHHAVHSFHHLRRSRGEQPRLCLLALRRSDV